MDINILMIIKRIFTDDISNYIFNIYLIDKYFAGTINNRSIELYKNKFMTNEYNEKVIDKINYKYLSLPFIKKLILLDNRITIRLLSKIPILIRFLDYEYKNNEEIIEIVTKKDNSLIKYASYELKGNKEFIRKMIDVFPASIYYAKKELKDDYELALKAIKLDGDTIEYLSDRLRNNDEIKKISKENSHNYYKKY